MGKAIRRMLNHVLGRFDEIIFTQYLNNPRAVPAEELAATARKLGSDTCRVCATPADAWDEVRSMATPEDLICVTGSVFIAAEMREQIVAHPVPVPAETCVKD